MAFLRAFRHGISRVGGSMTKARPGVVHAGLCLAVVAFSSWRPVTALACPRVTGFGESDLWAITFALLATLSLLFGWTRANLFAWALSMAMGSALLLSSLPIERLVLRRPIERAADLLSALRRYESDHGGLIPDRIEELVPLYIDDIPRPGIPSDGFSLYQDRSGPDGDPVPGRWVLRVFGDSWRGQDWVLRYEAQPTRGPSYSRLYEDDLGDGWSFGHPWWF
jgi:hypothetical protein